jgi:uncharacterized protein (TIGR03790 family)
MTSISSRWHAAIALCLLLVMAAAQAATPLTIPRASITPQELGIVIAAGDPVSEAIGTYYQQARGIPPENVVRINLVTGGEEISSVAFAALKAAVDQQLPVNVQATLLTWTQPFSVRGNCRMSITSAFAFGYDDKYCIVQPRLATASSTYFNSESTMPWNDFGIRPSMMLGATSLAAAQTLIARGKASDATYPAGTGYLVRTTDSARSVRWPDFKTLPATWNVPGGLAMNYVDASTGAIPNYITGKQGVLFYFTSLASVPNLNTNTYVPGAVGDHLTSFGGVLSNGYGQMMATAWLDAGMTGSYGTVEEPYNFTTKFPQASVMVGNYFRGATLIEAYWKSVAWPGEGLFVGEPLARPFASQELSTIQNGNYVIQTRHFSVGEYAIEYRESAMSPWISWARLNVTQPGTVTLQAPVVPASAVETRIAGPCTAPYFGFVSDSASVAGDRAQTAYFQYQFGNSGACIETINLAVAPHDTSPSLGMQPSLSTTTITLQPNGWSTAMLKVAVPANTGANGAVSRAFDVAISRAVDSVPGQLATATVNVQASGNSSVPTMHILRPQADWWFLVNPQSASHYPLPVEADVKPGSGIVSVSFHLAQGYTGGTIPPASALTVGGSAYAGTLVLEGIADDGYTLVATGYDSQGNVVATDSQLIWFSVSSDYPVSDLPADPAAAGDVPLPAWAILMLGAALAGFVQRGSKP